MEWMTWMQTIGALFALGCLMSLLMTFKKQLRAALRKSNREDVSFV